MEMTKKDYVLIADVLRKEYDAAMVSCGMGDSAHAGIYRVATELSIAFKEANPHFDEVEFLEAALG